MDVESCNWFRFAKILMDVGGEVFQELFSVYFQTSSFMEFLVFWHERVRNPGNKNYLSDMHSTFNQQLSSMDTASQRFLAPLIQSWKPDKLVRTVSQQMLELKKWDSDVKAMFSSSPLNVHNNILSAWSNNIQSEICRLQLLLTNLHEWNNDFQRHTKETQLILLGKIKKNQNDLLVSLKQSLVNLKNPTFNNLQSLAVTLKNNIQQALTTWLQECTDFLTSWEQTLKSLLNTWQQTQVQNTTNQQVLRGLITEFMNELTQLHGNCQQQLRSLFGSWHQDLLKLITKWSQKLLGSSPPSPDYDYQEELGIWVQDLDNCPAFQCHRLRDFLSSVRQNLKKKIFTEPQISILYPNQSFPNLNKFDITLLAALLTNVCSVCPPEMGWYVKDHTDNDTCTGTDIFRLRDCRNRFVGHIHPAKLPQDHYDELMPKAKDSLLRLASVCGNDIVTKIDKKFNSLKDDPIDPEREEHYKVQLALWSKSDLAAEISEMSSRYQAVEENVDHYIKTVEYLQNIVQSLQQGQSQFIDTQKSALDAVLSDLTEMKQFLLSKVQQNERDISELKEDISVVKKDMSVVKETLSDAKDRISKLERTKNSNDLTGAQKAMIASYKVHNTIQLNSIFVNRTTCQDLGEFYTNTVLAEGTKERLKGKRGMQQKKPEQVNSFRQLFEKDGNQITRIVLRGEAGLGKSTFLKKLLKTWCTFQDNRLNKVREGLESPFKVSSDELKDGDIMMKFDILLCVNLGKISDEKDFIDVIHKQIPVLKTHLSRDNLVNQMKEVNENRVLMIMDGLDEMDSSASCAPYIEQIVKGEEYPTMTVIVASRPWKIDRLHQSEPPAHIDVLIDMKGFSKKNSKLFAGKIFTNYYDDVDETAIEKFWDDVGAHDIAKDFIHVPLLMLFLVHVWYQDKSFPQTVLHLYLKMLDILVNRYVEKQKSKKTEASQISLQVKRLKDLPKLKKLSITEIFGEYILLAVCEVAAQYLLDDKQECTNVFKEEDLLYQLGKSNLQLALDIGLLSENDFTEAKDTTKKVIVSFPHRTFQELLAAIHLCCNESKFLSFLNRLETYNDVFQNEIIIRFITGISSQRGVKIFENIFQKCDVKPQYEYSQLSHMFSPYASFCKLYMKCVRESDEESTQFRLKHLYANNLQNLSAIVSRIKNITDIRSLILENIDFKSDKYKALLKCENLKYLALQMTSLDDTDLNLSLFPGLLLLFLNGVTMSSESSMLCNSLSKCTQLETLILRSFNLFGKLDLSGATCLSTLKLENVNTCSISLSQCTRLKSLTLRTVKLADDQVLDLSSATCISTLHLENVNTSSISLSQCTQLQNLTLKNVKLGDGKLGDGQLDLSDATCLSPLHLENVNTCSFSLSQCTQLQNLTLKNVKLGDGKLDLSGTTHLSKLCLRQITISSTSLSQCKQLQSLTLENVKLGDGNLDLSGATCLVQLSLENITTSVPISVISLSQCTQLSQCKQLQSLTLENVKLGDGKLDLSGTTCLSILCLRQITISSMSLSQCKQLQSLTLENVKLGDGNLDLSGATCLVQLSLENITTSVPISVISLSQCTQLHYLKLKNIKLSHPKLDLSGHTSLFELLLENVNASNISLSQCTQLQSVTLDKVKLADDQVLDLSGAFCLSKLCLINVNTYSICLSQCTQLQSLTLEDVKLSDGNMDLSGATSLSELCLEKVNILTISLSQCMIQQLKQKRVKLFDDKLDTSVLPVHWKSLC